MGSIHQALSILQSLSIEVTPLRQEVLNILAKSSVPITAYQILDKLKLQRASAKPMTVYRTLATFEKANLIHGLFMTNFYRTAKVFGCENIYAAGFVADCLCHL